MASSIILNAFARFNSDCGIGVSAIWNSFDSPFRSSMSADGLRKMRWSAIDLCKAFAELMGGIWHFVQWSR